MLIGKLLTHELSIKQRGEEQFEKEEKKKEIALKALKGNRLCYLVIKNSVVSTNLSRVNFNIVNPQKRYGRHLRIIMKVLCK